MKKRNVCGNRIRQSRNFLAVIVLAAALAVSAAGCGPVKAIGELWGRGEDKTSNVENQAGGNDAGELSGYGSDVQEPGQQSGPGDSVGEADGAGEAAADTGEADSGAAAEPVAASSSGRYVYATLGGECQKVYDEILALLLAHGESVRVSTLDTEVLDEAYKALTADYGEIFWSSGYVYTQYTRGSEMIGLDFAPNYTMTREERDGIQKQIDDRVEQILGGVPMGASEYERVRYVFDYLASNIDYVVGAPENQNIISVFLYGETVCQGYASATQYLLSELGIQSAIVTGEAEGTSHAWNLVRMDGEYYYVDTTWGNSSYAGEGAGLERFINYNYFGVTSEEIALTHTANDHFVLPDCTAQTDNYYVRENRYFTSWDPDAVGALLAEGYQTGDTAVSVRFSTHELYDQYLQYFIGEEHIADYCTGITSLYYVEDALQRVLIFRFV